MTVRPLLRHKLRRFACAAIWSLCGAVLISTAVCQATEPEPVLRRSFAQPAMGASTLQSVDIAETKETAQAEPAVPKEKSETKAARQRSATGKRATPVETDVPPPPSAIETPQKPAADWPKVLPAGKADGTPTPDVFTAEEITVAKARCVALLKGLDVVVVDEPPIKSGACCTPAPVQLISLGKNPQVALSPPASMTCDMVAALHKWVSEDVQPLAKKHLGAPVVGLQTMSSYSCRNAYGRKRGQLSEHGKANAVDIGSFATADAHETKLLADWGPTGWEIRAQIAAAQAAAKVAAEKAAAEKLAAEKVAAAKTKAPGGQTATQTFEPAQPTAKSAIPSVGTIIEGVPGLANRLPGAGPANEGRSGYGLQKPSQLGGPKNNADKEKVATGKSVAPVMLPVDAVTHSRKARFLREVHTAACKIFGTTLGPETNLAHKNHFHLDMAERTRGNFCE